MKSGSTSSAFIQPYASMSKTLRARRRSFAALRSESKLDDIVVRLVLAAYTECVGHVRTPAAGPPSGSLCVMADLDGWGPIAGFLSRLNDSDLTLAVVSGAGLIPSRSLTKEEAYSHKTRVRAILDLTAKSYAE